MTALEELQGIFNKLPLNVMEDIDKRVGDWLASGGSEDATYIRRQLNYAKYVIKAVGSDE